jgi:hypothetical protein
MTCDSEARHWEGPKGSVRASPNCDHASTTGSAVAPNDRQCRPLAHWVSTALVNSGRLQGGSVSQPLRVKLASVPRCARITFIPGAIGRGFSWSWLNAALQATTMSSEPSAPLHRATTRRDRSGRNHVERAVPSIYLRNARDHHERSREACAEHVIPLLGERIDRALPPGVARLPSAMEQFHRPQRRLVRQRLHEHVAILVGLRRPTDARSAALSIV